MNYEIDNELSIRLGQDILSEDYDEVGSSYASESQC